MCARTIRAGVGALAATAAIGLAACGGDDSGATPEETVTEVYSAIADQDFATVCELADESAQQALIEQSEDPEASCEDAAAEIIGDDEAADFADIEIGEPEIDGDSATVPITDPDGNEDEVALVQEDGEWKVTGE